MNTNSRRRPVVGETLYSLNIGNAARYASQALTPVVVIKVGIKYFTCRYSDNNLEREYHLGTWKERTEYCVNSRLYERQEEWFDERDAEACVRSIRSVFDVHTYGRNEVPLPILKYIRAVLEDKSIPPLQALMAERDALKTAAQLLLRDGLKKDDLRLALIAMKQDALNAEDERFCAAYDKAVDAARAALQFPSTSPNGNIDWVGLQQESDP